SYSNASNSWFKTHEGMTSSYTSALRIGLSPAISCFLFAFRFCISQLAAV
ncbi:hypothetical protein COCC4DRAFT_34593, partial [Bipolaris maydis ATCC 48331]